MATILIANADHKFSRVLAAVLARYRHTVMTARTGEETLRALETTPPAVVLLDLALLGLPGLQVLAEIRARMPRLPVVAVTGEVGIEIENRAREMGVTDVLRKRLSLDVIIHAVTCALEQAGRPASAIPLAASAGADPPTILVVDDEAELREMVGDFLRRVGYRVTVMGNGEAALDFVRATPPSLMVLDLYMPGLDGIDVLARLAAEHPDIGVIVLTSSQNDSLLRQALAQGAFDVLSKPVDLDQLALAVMAKLAMQERST